MGAILLTAGELRDKIAKIMERTIEMHRDSRAELDPAYVRPVGDVTDEEIDDFVACNPLMDAEIAENLLDPGLLGFSARGARVRSEDYEEFEQEFIESVEGWAENETWLAADDLNGIFAAIQHPAPPAETRLWLPDAEVRPGWVDTSRSALLIAREMIDEGKLLAELSWRDFEKLIAELLELEGWTVDLSRGTKDGGIDVVSSRSDPILGSLKAIWQAKRYGIGRKVRLSHARELSGVVAKEGATKGILVTTTSPTQGALDWVKQDEYRLSAKSGDDVRRWIERFT